MSLTPMRSGPFDTPHGWFHVITQTDAPGHPFTENKIHGSWEIGAVFLAHAMRLKTGGPFHTNAVCFVEGTQKRIPLATQISDLFDSEEVRG